MMPRHRQLQALLWIAAVLAGMALAMFLVGRIAYRHALQNQAAEARVLLGQRAQALERHIDRFRIMPAVLSLDPQLRETLQHPDDAVQRRRANERLVQLNFANRTSTLTLIDRNGIAVAASNWRESRSNVGHSYAFRPYFQLAMARGTGEFYAIGTVTQVPGYFIARAVYNEYDHDKRGAAIGA
ncbi:MAG TPA: cache domain-containing protein, partial [Lysobacter sp.]|nr:cache domain-containing protein [Lysobacter sp.]